MVEEAIPWKRDPELSTSVWKLWMELICPRNSIDVHTLRSVNGMRGAYKGAMQVAFDEITEGRHRRNVVQEERGWKLFFLIPRLLFSVQREEVSSQKQVGRQVEPVCIRRVVVPFGRKQQVVQNR